jgi:hypothetical protein
MTNDLVHFLLDILYLFGGIAALLLVPAAVDPQTNRSGLAPPKGPHAVRRPTAGRPLRTQRPDDGRDRGRTP